MPSAEKKLMGSFENVACMRFVVHYILSNIYFNKWPKYIWRLRKVGLLILATATNSRLYLALATASKRHQVLVTHCVAGWRLTRPTLQTGCHNGVAECWPLQIDESWYFRKLSPKTA